jgi:hypothetical protein
VGQGERPSHRRSSQGCRRKRHQRSDRPSWSFRVVVLVHVACRQQPDARAQFRLHVEDSFAHRHQLLGEQVTEPAGAFDGPGALWPFTAQASSRSTWSADERTRSRVVVRPGLSPPRYGKPCEGQPRSSLPSQLLFSTGKSGPRRACLIPVTALAPLLSHTADETRGPAPRSKARPQAVGRRLESWPIGSLDATAGP